MKRKIIISILIVIGITLIYFFSKSPFQAKNKRANLPYKVYPFRDSVYVFIPYKITVYNNRYKFLDIDEIVDENFMDYRANLLYNKEGVELGTYFGKSRNQYEKPMLGIEGDIVKWHIKIPFCRTVFPFYKRYFYYFKRHKLSNKNDVFEVKNISKDTIREQLIKLSYNFKNPREIELLIDSLYKSDNQKIFNIDFKGAKYRPKYLKAKINSKKQIAVNYADSLSIFMTSKEQAEWLVENALKNSKRFNDF